MIRFLVIAGAISVVLLVWSLFDIYFSPAAQIRRFPRGLWLLIVLIPIAGPLLWIRYGRPQRRRGMRTRRRPVAPDDDPDFLRKL